LHDAVFGKPCSMEEDMTRSDVLIVGAGPTGLALARTTAGRNAQVQNATIISNRVLAPLMPHNTNATMQSTKATIAVDHSNQ
jgi:thioredoxin reductase